MPRIRSVKPEFFNSADITDLTLRTRLFYEYLWTEADREGWLAWKPKNFRMRFFPSDDYDINALCSEITENGFVVLYTGDDEQVYGHIQTFKDHQVINNREAESVIAPRVKEASGRVNAQNGEGKEANQARVKDACTRVKAEGRKEGKGREHASQTRTSASPPPEGVDWKAWSDFDEHRRSTAKLRSSWTDLAKQKAANVLRPLSAEQQRACVDYSITGGYPGLYPEKAGKADKPSGLGMREV